MPTKSMVGLTAVKDEGKMKLSAESLKEVEWPRCANECAAIEHLGAGECASVCPSKFDQEKEDGPIEMVGHHWICNP